MARQVAEVTPGVSAAVFDVHTHNYRKLTWIGVDDNDKYLTPDKMEVQDDAETVAATMVDAEAVGVTVATAPTSPPV